MCRIQKVHLSVAYFSRNTTYPFSFNE